MSERRRALLALPVQAKGLGGDEHGSTQDEDGGPGEPRNEKRPGNRPGRPSRSHG